MITKDALKQLEVAEWNKEQRLKALESLERIKNSPTEQNKKGFRIDKKTIVFRIVK